MTTTENVTIQMTKTQATHLTWLLGAMRFDWAEQQGVGREEVQQLFNAAENVGIFGNTKASAVPGNTLDLHDFN
jgi:hypothetical protein